MYVCIQLITKNLELPALSNVPQNLDFDKKSLKGKINKKKKKLKMWQ